MLSGEFDAVRPFLNEADWRELDALIRDEIWCPLPGPQRIAYDSEADVIGYGGAAGGGKTDLALGKALNQHKRVAVFRVNGTEHEAFIDRLEEVIGNRSGFNGQKGIWRNAGPRNVQIEMGSFPNLGEERKYRGRPHDLKIFDEAGEMLEQQVRFLMTWLRTTIKGQRCQVLMCFNPPATAEGRWLIDFFAPWLDRKHTNPALPGELRWFAMIDGVEKEVANGNVIEHDGEQIRPQSRTFIPAKVTDNPYLMETGYMTQLQALPEPLRSQMLKGDFQAGMSDDAFQLCSTEWVDAAMDRWTLPVKLDPMDSLGIDVARGGVDNTIIARRHKMWFNQPLVYPGTATPDGPTVAGLTIAASRDGAPQHIDIIGVGSSPYDFLMAANQPVYGINMSDVATGFDKSGRLRFKNMRSMMWWKMREALDPTNNTGICLPPSKQLRNDLVTPIWKLQGAIIYVEGREDIVKRLGRSADYGTAYCLSLFDTPKLSQVRFNDTRNGMARDYDPYNSHDYNPY